jgi:uncharacterized membrane protein
MGNLTTYFGGLLVIVIGFLLWKYPPNHINNSLGYRTPFSMKSKDTWYEGNRFYGILLFICGTIFIAFSVVIRYLLDFSLILSTKISNLSLVILVILSILCTEIHLRKLFDKKGVRK